jgi:pilus assembly protein Flp/PilA
MFTKTFRSLLQDESGATAIEYGLIAALVSVAAIGALTAMGGSLNTMYTSVSDTLSCAVDNTTCPAPAVP